MELPFKIDLTGKTAVVTGAGGVLCSRFAEALASCGAKVALLDINLENVQRVADKINGTGGPEHANEANDFGGAKENIYEPGGIARAYKANVLDRDMIDAVAQQVRDDLGPCDILINGAGGNSPRAQTDKEYYEPGDLDSGLVSFFDLDPDGVSYVFNLNFLGTLIPTQSFARQIGEGGVILNISSMNAYTPLTKIPAYSGAKAAVSNFTQWLAVHFSKVGVRVNAIAPGFFVTTQNKDLLFDPEGNPTSRAGKILAATPMERFGRPEELIGTLLYLVSNEAASFITGVVVPVDGGFSAYSGV